jgi:hypothetical protein
MDLARHMVWFPPSAEDHRLWIESKGLNRKDLVVDPQPLVDILEKEARFGDTEGIRIGK